MSNIELLRTISIPNESVMSKLDYKKFITDSFQLMAQHSQYFASEENINSLELAHLIPPVHETVIAIYVGINDAVCNKGLITPLLPRHGHNNVFVFDPQIYPGGDDVPAGTMDARKILNGFQPPNNTWPTEWTYVMIEDTDRKFQSLWHEQGYIDMIAAKFEDFTMLSNPEKTKVCTFIAQAAFDHPVNLSRPYLKQARDRGQKTASEFHIPPQLEGEFEGLVPVILNMGEKLYVATTDFGPCAHGWSNIHPDNEEFAVVNENSAVPLDLVIAKPPVNEKYNQNLLPPKGSADMTTDWFYRGQQIVRKPLLEGLFKG